MSRILGQDRAVAQLQDALRSGKVHHAWIFHGPFGVGKYTAAVEFAALLLNPSLSEQEIARFEADPAAESTRLIRANAHPDFHTIDRERAQDSSDSKIRAQKQTNIPIGVIRQFIIGGSVGEKFHEGPAYLTANQGHGKVFIIDEAEYLDEQSQNALLKTLEEPPPRTYLILIATQEQWLLPTIRSRCQRTSFTPISSEAFGTWLDGQPAPLPPDPRTWVERFAAGSPGVAQVAITGNFYAFAKSIEPHLDRLNAGRFPPALGDALNAFLSEFAEAAIKENDQASKDAANKDATSWLLRILAMSVRGRLHQAIAEGEIGAATAAAGVIDLLQETERQINSNVNIKLALADLIAQWQSKVTRGSGVVSRAG